MHDYRLPQEKLNRLVHRRLARVLRSAYLNVPYYRNIMDGAGYNPISDYNGPQDLKYIRITSKQDLNKEGCRAFLKDKCELPRCFSDSTSGSSGTPIKILRGSYEQKINIARWLRVLFVNGYSVRDKVMSLSAPHRLSQGRSIVQKFGILRRLPIDYFHNSTSEMTDLLLAYQPNVLYGNRSHIEAVALELGKRKMKYDGLKILIGTGEIIGDHTRGLCRDRFNIELTESYGSVEMGVIAHDTPERDGLHLCDDLIYFEFLDENSEAAQPGIRCRIVMTDLIGTTMPLIRYDIGDMVVFDSAINKRNERVRRITEILGRDSDFVILPDGTKRFVYDFSILLKKYDKICQFRVIQQSLNRFQIIIQAEESYFHEIIDDLVGSLNNHFTQHLEFEITRADRIAPEATGKTKLLVSMVSRHN